MEAESGECSHLDGTKRQNLRKKLLVGDEVEVRLADEGLKGSWHRAVVVKCENGARFVKYNEILAEDNSTKLVERIAVTRGADGLVSRRRKPYRGWIRPFPVSHDGVEELGLAYGTCVDCLIDGVWWEGVIFDKDEGLSRRTVLFPDQGDQHMIDVGQMRSTFDWHEISGDWKLRGTWTLATLLCELEKKGPFPISVREIFYDVSCTSFYAEKIEEWMFGSSALWEHLVSVAIEEALAVSLGENPDPMDFIASMGHTDNPASEDLKKTNDLDAVCLDGDAPRVDDVCLATENVNGGLAEKGQPDGSQSEHHGTNKKKHLKKHKDAGKCDPFGPSRTRDDDSLDASDSTTKTSDEMSECVANVALLRQEILRMFSHSHKRAKIFKGSKVVRRKAKRYLLSIGWKTRKLECGVDQFISPTGTRYMTLKSAILACGELETPAEPTTSTTRSLVVNDCDSKSTHKRETRANALKVVPEEEGHCDSKSTQKGETRAKVSTVAPEEELLWQPTTLEAEYCTESLFTFAQYLEKGKPALRKTEAKSVEAARVNLRKHLLSLGWTILSKDEQMIPKGEKRRCVQTRRRYLYVSPEGEKFTALGKLAGYLMKTGEYCSSGNTHAGNKWHCSELPCSLDAIERDAMDTEHLVAESCPEALLDYVNTMENKNDKLATFWNKELKINKVKALKHLLYLGWTFVFVCRKNKYYERRYNSPNRKRFYSLLGACKASLQEQMASGKTETGHITNKVFAVRKADNFSLGHARKLKIKFHPPVKGDLMQEYNQFSDAETEMCSTDGKSKRGVKKMNCRKNGALVSSVSFEGLNGTPHKRCSKLSNGHKKIKKRKVSATLDDSIADPSSGISSPNLSKQARAVTKSPARHKPRTVLSWLLDNGALFPRQKVKYLHKRDGHVMMEGRITREGIKCNCCRKVLTLSNFEVHAGSTNCRPSAHIFLKDGRSLLDCQRQLIEAERRKDFPHKRIKRDYSDYPSDAICSICQEGGILVLCDYCPSSFHLNCVGLKDVPEGQWFCPSCRCNICGLSEFNGDCQKFTPETKLFCDQCECEYHVGCLQESGLATLTTCPEGDWLCSKTCSEIFWQLRKLIGKTNPTTSGNYTWTILRAKKENDLDFGTLDKEAITEGHSKLHVALDVLHECFLSIIEPRTKSDLVADLLYNRESELNRLNFWGFYTMTLEKGDEVVSVATFRVYGKKVAEMPLVGTRVQYRRMGMCRLLINELEKLLKSMGVERLLLPAVPDLLETWTRSFGFTVMTGSDKLMLSRHTFLSFQGTKMCQKLLTPTFEGSEELLGNIEKVEKDSTTNMEVADYNGNGNATQEVPEMVPPLTLPRPAADNACALPCKNGMIDSEVNSGGSFPIGACSDYTGPLQGGDDAPCSRKESKDGAPKNIAPVEFDHNCNSEASDSAILAVNSVGVNFKVGDQVYKSPPRAGDGISNFLMKSSDAFRYFYKRRVLAS